ncbi:MAG: hypothetical protein ACI4VQ_00505, partial [Clostridia bacterium]
AILKFIKIRKVKRMKLQHLAIIFVIIILPISIILSVYTDHQIKVITYQAQYSSYLLNATYDSIKAFQLNTINNKYSTIGNSKIRDIEAAVNVFYGSLATNLGASGYTKEDLHGYTPAILFTLYDGYYIYSNYYDTVKGEYEYGLKPFIYYSCRYVKGSNYDFVVNYTLDNTITIIGKVGSEGYVTKTGHLIYDDGTISNEREVLTENIITLDNPNTPVSYQYIIYNNQKIYKENRVIDSTTDWKQMFFYYDSAYTKTYIQTDSIIDELKTYLDGSNNFSSDSAIKYYDEARTFSEWVNNNLGTITAANAVDSQGNTITDFASDTGNDKIFEINANNNPLQSSSTFNEHRRNVIRKSIETNLYTSIKTFSEHTVIGYEFGMPKISEDEWEKITNNISIVSFLQGIPIGGKVYNDYCVVSNDSNKESVNNNSIYIITKDTSGNVQYHNPGCRTLLEKVNNNELTIIGAYASVDFKRQSVSLTGSDANAGGQLTGADEGGYAYFYPQQGTSCYDCIVTASDAYSTDDIIKGEIVIRNSEGVITRTINTTNNNGLKEIRIWYMRALARTRYDLYLTNGYFGH